MKENVTLEVQHVIYHIKTLMEKIISEAENSAFVHDKF